MKPNADVLTESGLPIFDERRQVSPRAVARSFVRVGRSAGGCVSGVGVGSFALVGREVSDHPPDTGPSLYLAVEIGELCQLRCKHCIYHRRAIRNLRPHPLTPDWLRDGLSDGLDPLWISLAGKEPTLFARELCECARLCARPGRSLILMTNGLLLEGGLLKELSEYIDCYDVSLDGDEKTHEWFRGPGTFRRTWKNLGAVLHSTPATVGVIATFVRGRVGPGVASWEPIVRLARQLKNDFGVHPRLSLSVSLYFGEPRDPFLLAVDDLNMLIEGLKATGFPCRILYTAHYARLWPIVARAQCWSSLPVRFDRQTRLPVVVDGCVTVIPFHLSPTPQFVFRISNDGYLYLGCNHLNLGEEAARHRLADLAGMRLSVALAHCLSGEHPLLKALEWAPRDCAECPEWDFCLGGDRLSGILFDDQPADPFCPWIDRVAHVHAS